jgi:hypothetical protein
MSPFVRRGDIIKYKINLHSQRNRLEKLAKGQAVFQIFQESVTKGKEYHVLLKHITCILQKQVSKLIVFI